MNNDINVVFFDLFFTLVTPKYNDLRNENDVLRIKKEEWKKYSEDIKDLTQIPLKGTFYSQEDNDSSLIFTWIKLSQISSMEIYPEFLKDEVFNLSDHIKHFIYRE